MAEDEAAAAEGTSSSSVRFMPAPEIRNDDDDDQPPPQAASSADSSSCLPSNLRVLIVTTNMGNARPTPESVFAAVPTGGSVDEVLKSPPVCPLPNGMDGPRESDRGGQFDIIVFGAQEAVFNAKSKRMESQASQLDSVHEEEDGGGEGVGGDGRVLTVRSDDSIVSAADANARANAAESSPLNGDPTASSATQRAGNATAANESANASSSKRRVERKSSLDHLVPTLTDVTKTVASPLRAVTDAATDKVLKPVATTLVSAAGSTDHTKKRGALGNAVGASALSNWVGGTEELNEMFSAVLNGPPGETEEEVKDGRYESVVRFQRGEMRLAVLVRNEVLPSLGEVNVDAENTGIAGVVANKGGIIATLTFGHTRLSFMTAHLEAHEGAGHYKNRCANLAEILEGARDVFKSRFDASITSHHMFVCGDLNFRVALPKPGGKVGSILGDDNKWDGEEHRRVVRGMVDRQEWAALNDADELHGALDKGDCLAGFQTLQCHFNPTFKVHREAGFHYQEKRTPSYTDRILWKSAHGLTDHVRPLLYEPVPDFTTSDHKPVRGAFAIKMDQPRHDKSPGERRSQLAATRDGPTGRNLHIFISDMQCTDLPEPKKEVLNSNLSPYIMFVTDPKDLLRLRRSKRQVILDKLGFGGYAKKYNPKHGASKIREGWPRTRVYKGDGPCNPDWGDAEVQLKVCKPGVHGAADLAGGMLYMAVYDMLGVSPNVEDALIGTVALNLQELAKEKKADLGASLAVGAFQNKQSGATDGSSFAFDMIDIDEPILRNGVERGRLSCSVVPWWVDPDLEGLSFSKRRSVRNLKAAEKGSTRACCVVS